MTRAPIFDALARLPEWRMVRTGQYKACCPAHDDHDPSLDISIGADGRVLLICRSQGCTAEAIVTALGATMADLFEPRAPDDAKGKGTGRGRTETHRYPAYDAETGKAVGVHVRKDTWDANGVKLPKRMWWEPKGIKLPPLALYGIADAQQAKANGGRLTVIVTEGERKRDELHAALAKAGRLDWVAVGTMTGAGVTPCDAALRALAGCDVVLWPDNADDGRLHMQRIGARLDALGVTGWRWLDWPDAPSKGDASDYVAVGGTVAGLDALIRRSSERKQSSTPNDHLSEWDGGELLSTVTPQAVSWLWNGYIPLGKLTMGDGDPGLGKTMLFAADLTARVTTGAAMPDGTPGLAAPAGVVIFTAEDDPADTLLPRLVAAGGDPSKVIVVTTMQRPETDPNATPGSVLERLSTFADLAFIERKIDQVGAKLVIFDPYVAYLPPKVDNHRDQDVRSALAPLARLAQTKGVAIVLIRHLNRGSFDNPLYRGMGSIGIVGASRAATLLVKHPDDENVRIFGSYKHNLAKAVPSWKFRIGENAAGVPALQWEGVSDRDAQDVLGIPTAHDTTSKLEGACELLREALVEKPQTEEHLTLLATAQGISRATLRRAKDLLGVQSEKVGFGRSGYWVWSLPSSAGKGDDGDDEDDAKGDHDDDEHAHTPPASAAGRCYLAVAVRRRWARAAIGTRSTG